MAQHSPRAGALLRRGGSSGGRRDPLAALGEEPLAAETAHVLDEGEQRAPLRRQRVLDARWDLRERLALHDPLLLERTKAQRKRARADPGERALELAEAAAAGGEIADHEHRPLLTDDVRGGANGALLVEGPLGCEVTLHEMKYSPRRVVGQFDLVPSE